MYEYDDGPGIVYCEVNFDQVERDENEKASEQKDYRLYQLSLRQEKPRDNDISAQLSPYADELRQN